MKTGIAKIRASAISLLLLTAFIVSALSSLVPLEQGQAQLFINGYPSQDNPTSETLWIFSGSSTANSSRSIRTSGNYSTQDSFAFTGSNGNIFDANKPNNVNFSLSPLFSRSNIKDIHSVSNRIPGGSRTDITFAASATNAPTITSGSNSRTISHLFMHERSGLNDQMGIRVSGSALSYSSGQTSAWVGAGIINKPIGDFFAGTFNNRGSVGPPNFAALSDGSVRVVVNSQVIPEPEEYALIFALFALVLWAGLRFLSSLHGAKETRRRGQDYCGVWGAVRSDLWGREVWDW